MSTVLCYYGCNQVAKFKYKNGKHCCSKSFSSCPKIQSRKQQTNRRNFGTYFPAQSIKGKERMIKTLQEKYGVNTPFKMKDFRKKAIKTWLEKYGMDNPGKLPQSIEKAKNKSAEHIQKLKDHIEIMTREPKVIAKRKKTNQERYGGNAPTSSKQVMKKQRATNIERYGVDNQFKRPEIRKNSAKYGKRSKISQQWLKQNKVPITEHWIDSLSLAVDGYDPSTNTIYEFYGDYWHGNPKRYKSDDINPTKNITFGELHLQTLAREKLILKEGYILVSVWEKSFKDGEENFRQLP